MRKAFVAPTVHFKGTRLGEEGPRSAARRRVPATKRVALRRRGVDLATARHRRRRRRARAPASPARQQGCGHVRNDGLGQAVDRNARRPARSSSGGSGKPPRARQTRRLTMPAAPTDWITLAEAARSSPRRTSTSGRRRSAAGREPASSRASSSVAGGSSVAARSGRSSPRRDASAPSELQPGLFEELRG